MLRPFSLKWNNYQASLTNAFKSLLENEDFVDMTLSAGGEDSESTQGGAQCLQLLLQELAQR